MTWYISFAKQYVTGSGRNFIMLMQYYLRIVVVLAYLEPASFFSVPYAKLDQWMKNR